MKNKYINNTYIKFIEQKNIQQKHVNINILRKCVINTFKVHYLNILT